MATWGKDVAPQALRPGRYDLYPMAAVKAVRNLRTVAFGVVIAKHPECALPRA
ncbi:MAG: hypothetical protein QOH05_2187 [Acetobacteraceae bacterium]|nr:hypothetical protein [Acetobacteraceae bacterium]